MVVEDGRLPTTTVCAWIAELQKHTYNGSKKVGRDAAADADADDGDDDDDDDRDKDATADGEHHDVAGNAMCRETLSAYLNISTYMYCFIIIYIHLHLKSIYCVTNHVMVSRQCAYDS